MKELIKQLQKTYELETSEYATYYAGGTLCVDMQIEGSSESFQMVNIRNISDMKGNEKELQYIASLLYVKMKNDTAAFYAQAKANIKYYETGNYITLVK